MSRSTPTQGTQFAPDPGATDWQKLRADFDKEAARALQAFRDEVQRMYEEKARASLKTSSDKYLAGLSVSVSGDDGVEALIQGWLPVALDTEGAGRFDMKPGLLGGRAVRTIRLENGNIRTVSTMSPPGSWWHPGIQARNISDQVKAEEHAMHEKVVAPLFASFFARIEV
jgi:hypothetical protein